MTGTRACWWNSRPVTTSFASFITHAHADHVDGERLGKLLADNPAAELVLNAHTQASLAGLWDVAPRRMRVVGPKSTFVLRGVKVEVVGGDHACIHAALPTVPNNGYIIDGGLHPGDAPARRAGPPSRPRPGPPEDAWRAAA
ncbi:MBL fold metallo-hydrolase [Streptomyces violaceusniger]|uniref:Metallo-beta-lactamase domain-containing protein n=1 Tax=Streptomyces violaceusniger TaxID=68280 RepID=A0A4D4KSP4_STRVO|nr:hypothetical protein SVIO_005290 [Streptomyces violaceusniger]